ncbi:MAG: hypothetical protein ACLRM9_04790 [Collinsella aerofaciens]
MLWSYVQLDDGTQFAYSETREDGTVRIAVERPVDFGFDHAECFLPAVKWFNVEGFTADDLNFLTEFVRSNAPFIFELAERQKAGPAVAYASNSCFDSMFCSFDRGKRRTRSHPCRGKGAAANSLSLAH